MLGVSRARTFLGLMDQEMTSIMCLVEISQETRTRSYLTRLYVVNYRTYSRKMYA